MQDRVSVREIYSCRNNSSVSTALWQTLKSDRDSRFSPFKSKHVFFFLQTPGGKLVLGCRDCFLCTLEQFEAQD